MSLVDIIRAIVPSQLRIAVGLKAINLASHNTTTLRLFLATLHGKYPSNIGLTKNNSYYKYNGIRILAPKDAAGVFLEIFQDKVYEQVFKPKINDVVIDIGAYVGMFSVKASDAVGKEGMVIAVEPCPENYNLLSKNTLSCNNIKLVKVAIMDKEGEGKLYYSNAAAANSLVLHRSGKYDTVSMITLDRLVKDMNLKHVDFIKIDAEGVEMEVLKGATETLKNGTKLVIAAYHTTANGDLEIRHVEKYLQNKGYKIKYQRGLRSYIYAEKTN